MHFSAKSQVKRGGEEAAIALLEYLNQYILVVCVGAILVLAGAGVFFCDRSFPTRKSVRAMGQLTIRLSPNGMTNSK